MKLEIQVNVADDVADKVELAEHLRKEAILALFADRKITAGKAAGELGLERLPFMELLKRRGIPYIIYSAEDWAADATAIDEFERTLPHDPCERWRVMFDASDRAPSSGR